MLALFCKYLYFSNNLYFFTVHGFSIPTFIRTWQALPLFYSVFTTKTITTVVARPGRSLRMYSAMKPFLKGFTNWANRKFRFIASFLFSGKRIATQPTIKKKFPHILSFFAIFSKIQFKLDPKAHPFTGTKLHTNAIELKWKKSWDNFIRSFFVKRAKRWYLWEKKTRKKNSLYKAIGTPLLELTKFLRKTRIKKLKRWEKRSPHIIPKCTVAKPSKPFFLNHLFHLYRLRLPYKKLRFIAKHFRSLYPKHLSKFKFKTPYFFLHLPYDTIRSVVPLISSVITRFKRSRSLPKTFKRSNRRQKSQIFTRVRLASVKIKASRLFRRKIKNPLSFTKYKVLPLPLLKLTRTFVFSPQTLLMSDISSTDFPFILGRWAKQQKTTSLNSIKFPLMRWRRRRYFYRFKFREWAQVLRFVRKLYFRKMSFSFCPTSKSTVSYMTSYLSPQNGVCEFSALRQDFTKRISNVYLNTLSFLSHIVNSRLLRKDLVQAEIDLATIPNKLFIYPEYGLIFVLPSVGFLLLSHFRPFTYFRSDLWGMYKLRKLKYSFAIKNEFPKHILRKYSHAKLSLEHFFQSRIGQKLDNHIQPHAVGAIFKGYEENWADTFFSATSLSSTFLYPAADTTSPVFSNFEFKFLDKAYKPAYTIFTTRFKPGYMRLWRRARSSLQVRTKTYFRYQHQLTEYLLMFKRGVHLPTTATDEFKIQNLLVKSRLVLDKNNARIFILRKVVFVNGLICINPRFQLYAGDFLQLIVSFKYYTTFRWLLNHNQKIKMRIKNLSKNLKLKKAARNPDKKYNKRTPDWVSRYTSLFLDISKYMEVDFFTLSAFLLHDPLSWNDINVYAETILKPQIFNMYNWKYIN